MVGLIFAYISLFPFGKLTLFLPDLIVGFLSILLLRKGVKKINNFILICLFSLIFSLSIFNISQIFVGFLYFLRFVSYVLFSQIVYQKFGKTNEKRKLIINSLIVVGIFVAIFGWIQYLIFPDLRALKTLGWDDHYFRLVSTFLDPAFTGIILVLTEILVLIKTVVKKSSVNYLLNIFLILTILFTYSRSSYLALFFAFAFLLWKFREKFIVILGIMFVVLIFVLPKAPSEGTNLLRTYSVGQKFINYEESFRLIKKSPLFGIGFDNLCISKLKFLGEENVQSHTCSGLDNSILYIVATTGIIGLIIFIDWILRIVKNTRVDIYGTALFASIMAVFVHGMFTNTFFYNFILGWMAILIGVTRSRVKSDF